MKHFYFFVVSLFLLTSIASGVDENSLTSIPAEFAGHIEPVEPVTLLPPEEVFEDLNGAKEEVEAQAEAHGTEAPGGTDSKNVHKAHKSAAKAGQAINEMDNGSYLDFVQRMQFQNSMWEMNRQMQQIANEVREGKISPKAVPKIQEQLKNTFLSNVESDNSSKANPEPVASPLQKPLQTKVTEEEKPLKEATPEVAKGWIPVNPPVQNLSTDKLKNNAARNLLSDKRSKTLAAPIKSTKESKETPLETRNDIAVSVGGPSLSMNLQGRLVPAREILNAPEKEEDLKEANSKKKKAESTVAEVVQSPYLEGATPQFEETRVARRPTSLKPVLESEPLGLPEDNKEKFLPRAVSTLLEPLEMDIPFLGEAEEKRLPKINLFMILILCAVTYGVGRKFQKRKLSVYAENYRDVTELPLRSVPRISPIKRNKK